MTTSTISMRKNINSEHEHYKHWTYESAFHLKIHEKMGAEIKNYCGEFPECCEEFFCSLNEWMNRIKYGNRNASCTEMQWEMLQQIIFFMCFDHIWKNKTQCDAWCTLYTVHRIQILSKAKKYNSQKWSTIWNRCGTRIWGLNRMGGIKLECICVENVWLTIHSQCTL